MRPRFPFRDQEIDRDGDRGNDFRGDNRGRDGDRPRDDGNRYTKENKDHDRSRIRDHGAVDDHIDLAQDNADSDEVKKAKRSRWSNTATGTSGLDDASHTLAKNTALEIAAKFANLSKGPAGDEPSIDKPEPEPEVPPKPVIDITQVNTEETVSNVLGQLYDDDDEEDDDEPSTAASAVVEQKVFNPEPVVEANNGTLRKNVEVAAVDDKVDTTSTNKSEVVSSETVVEEGADNS